MSTFQLAPLNLTLASFSSINSFCIKRKSFLKSPAAFSKRKLKGSVSPLRSRVLTVIFAFSLYSGMLRITFSLLRFGTPNVPCNPGIAFLYVARTTTLLLSSFASMVVVLPSLTTLTASISPTPRVCFTISKRYSLIGFSFS